MDPSERKIFGIGLSKTGTSSLSEALNLLGIPSFHYPNDDVTFAELARGEYRLSILRHYRSLTDTPVAPFYAQLDRAWPGSRFVLTVREKGRWLESAEAHWKRLKETGPRAGDARFQAFTDFVNTANYGCIHFNAERFSYAYDLHVKNVRDYFADRPDDLLVLDICRGEGWEELCAFLGVPVPKGTLFPHANRDHVRTMVHLTKADLAALAPDGEPVVLLDHDQLRDFLGPEGAPLPFSERDGRYWGFPESDAAAIAELERLRAERGAAYLAVSAWSSWALEHYPDFAAHVRSRYGCVLDNERLVVFDLRP